MMYAVRSLLSLTQIARRSSLDIITSGISFDYLATSQTGVPLSEIAEGGMKHGG